MTKRTRWLGLVLTLATITALLVPGSALALPANPPKLGLVCLSGPTFNLVATSGTIQTPDGNSVFMWSYADGSGQFQYPGPFLCVNEGETVTVNLTNNLPETTSIVFPGQEGVMASGGVAGLLTTEAPANGTVSYTFTASQPGTYLYESGSDISKQVEMGLYGGLIVRPSMGANFAYDNAATQFDTTREYVILLGEVALDFHHEVELGHTPDFNTLRNRYFTVNGRSFPDTLQANGSALYPTQPYGALVRIQPTTPTGQPALIRMLNAGADNHPFHPHGNHLVQIGQDGRLFLSPGDTSASTERFGETIGSGQTEDYTIRWDNTGTDTSGTPFNDDWNPVNNLLPPQPNYQNLTFKDGNTWYSGNPYLGYKGTLPVGTTSQNVCGEWYFPWHSHALNEFTNYDEGFGGMATLLRVDPFGGCFTFPSSTTLLGSVLKSGNAAALAAIDSTYYQVNPRTTTLGTAMPSGSPATSLSSSITAAQTSILVASNSGFPAAPYYVQIGSEILRVTGKSAPASRTWAVSRGQLGTTAATHTSGSSVAYANIIDVASAAGFPTSGPYYVRIDNEVLQVTAGQGTTHWTVSRAQLGSSAATHAVNAIVSALVTDWYAGFSGVPAGSQNLKVTYEGKNCGSTTGTTCASLTTNLPLQTTSICDWTVAGAAGCTTLTGTGAAGWVTLPAPQNFGVGSNGSGFNGDTTTTWALPGAATNYIGTGAYAGQVRVLIHTQRWTAPSPAPFSTWANFMSLVYGAP